MINLENHVISDNSSINDALLKLDYLGSNAVLFAVDSQYKLIGALTDGDVRRGLLKGFDINNNIIDIIQKQPKFIKEHSIDIYKIIEWRNAKIKILPVLDINNKLIRVINLNNTNSCIPIDVVIMAGGKGIRLHPLTLNTPKPLLKVGDKAIIEHNIERLYKYGITNFWVSVRYLGDQIKNKLGNGNNENQSIKYVWEDTPKGTIGAVSKITNFINNHVLITNSDILTNLNYESFYLDFLEKDADLSIVSIPYKVTIPYAVLETKDNYVKGFKEKPTYTYFSNAGIYLIKRELLDYIPKDSHFDATDLVEVLIKNDKKVISYEFFDYWLDVGKTDDFEKAQKDIKNIQF